MPGFSLFVDVQFCIWMLLLVNFGFGMMDYKEAILRAQCKARCLKEYGQRVKLTQTDTSYDVYTPYECPDSEDDNKDNECKSCFVPCDTVFSPSRCKASKCSLKLGKNEVSCRKSCRFLFGQYGRTSTRLSDSEGWFTLGTSKEALVPINGLSVNNTYEFQVTAVLADGMIQYPVQTDPVTTDPGIFPIKPIKGAYLISNTTEDGVISALVVWDPAPGDLCFYKVIWHHPESAKVARSSYDQNECRMPFPELKYKLTNLDFASDYTITIRALDETKNFTEIKDSEFIFEFSTPSCLEATNGNHTMCAPGVVEEFRFTMKIDKYFNNKTDQTATVNLKWKPPKSVVNKNFLKKYRIDWKKTTVWNSTITFVPHGGEVILDKNVTSYVLRNLSINSLYQIDITAISDGGESKPVSIRIRTDEKSAQHSENPHSVESPAFGLGGLNFTPFIAVIAIIVGAIIAICAICVYLFKKKKKKTLSNNGEILMDFPFTTNSMYIESSTDPVSSSETEHSLMVPLILPLETDDYEISFNSLTLEKTVGQGAFGKVAKGILNPSVKLKRLHKISANTMGVAVKMLKDFASAEDQTNMLREIQLMKQLGRHPFVVSMLACCTKGPDICLVMDYCPLGDLRTYLKKIREKNAFLKVSERPTRCQRFEYADMLEASDSGLSEQESSGYLIPTPSCTHADEKVKRARHYTQGSDSARASSVSSCESQPTLGVYKQNYTGSGYSENTVMSEDENVDKEGISINQLLSYARQIAVAMEYLAQKKFVHRDLAARNILVAEKNLVKISDFGLTRDIYENSIYRKNSNGKLPLKWMSIEAIFDQEYTIKSDVWSYGIVLWELVTLGGSPYPGVSSSELLKLIQDGYRMMKPDNCSQEMYDVMLACWHPNPADRPDFTQLRNKLDEMLENSNPYMDFKLDGNKDYYYGSSSSIDGSGTNKNPTEKDISDKMSTSSAESTVFLDRALKGSSSNDNIKLNASICYTPKIHRKQYNTKRFEEESQRKKLSNSSNRKISASVYDVASGECGTMFLVNEKGQVSKCKSASELLSNVTGQWC